MRKNYENLANAIIEQAVKDHGAAAKFLKRYPNTEELESIVTEAQRKRDECKALGLKPERKTKEERIWDKILSCRAAIAETEDFILSDWFTDLTDVNGEWLLNHIRRMEDES